MNDKTTGSSALFTTSGCLTGDSLMLFVSGSLQFSELEKAQKHLAECALCSDAAEGLKLWLNKSKVEQIHDLNQTPAAESGITEISGKHSLPSQNKINPIGPNSNLFHNRTDAINNRIKQRLHAHSRHEATEEKRLSYKPFVWLSVAATILLFITIGYVLWLQNQFDAQKLAKERAEEMLMLENPVNPDTLMISLPANKPVFAMNERNGNKIQRTIGIPSLDETDNPADPDPTLHAVNVPEKLQEKEHTTAIEKANEMQQVTGASHPATTRNSALPVNEGIADKSKTVFTLVDEMPLFPGGEAARIKFLAENVRYPIQAVENGVQGIIYIGFVVNTDGKLTDLTILRGIGSGCDEEAIRVIKKMPRWIPGKQNGNLVDVFLTMPITFKLEK